MKLIQSRDRAGRRIQYLRADDHNAYQRTIRWTKDANGRWVRVPYFAPPSTTTEPVVVRQDAPTAPSSSTECFLCPDCHRCLAHSVCKCEPPDIEEPAWLATYNPEDDLRNYPRY